MSKAIFSSSLQSRVYTREKAEKVANELRENEVDRWTYAVEVSPEGKFARIAVFDECGTFMGRY